LRRWVRVAVVVVLTGVAAVVLLPRSVEWRKLVRKFSRPSTVAQRLTQYGPAARKRLAPAFRAAGVMYPPAKVVMLVLKQEKRLELYAAGGKRELRYIKTYPVLAASGHSGPKLREGDGQVPEGVYRVESLNPNSLWHLSLRLDYPNEFDRAMAAKDGRTKLGGDIMIHGYCVSIGCVAVGDEGSEDLFVLAADAGRECCMVVIAPRDLRTGSREIGRDMPVWTDRLYDSIAREMRGLCAPPK
jgi:hypothetical protein